MSDRLPRLGTIAAWLQREDEMLLYTPDGEVHAPGVWVTASTPQHARAWAYEIFTTTEDGGYFVPGELAVEIRAGDGLAHGD